MAGLCFLVVTGHSSVGLVVVVCRLSIGRNSEENEFLSAKIQHETVLTIIQINHGDLELPH